VRVQPTGNRTEVCGEEGEAGRAPTERMEASAKRDEQRSQDKEEQMQSFANIQSKTLKVQQRKLDLAKVKERARAKGLELKKKECETILLAEESKIMMTDLTVLDPKRRKYFEKKQAMIHTCDA
jgi:hypothetical protein